MIAPPEALVVACTVCIRPLLLPSLLSLLLFLLFVLPSLLLLVQLQLPFCPCCHCCCLMLSVSPLMLHILLPVMVNLLLSH